MSIDKTYFKTVGRVCCEYMNVLNDDAKHFLFPKSSKNWRHYQTLWELHLSKEYKPYFLIELLWPKYDVLGLLTAALSK